MSDSENGDGNPTQMLPIRGNHGSQSRGPPNPAPADINDRSNSGQIDDPVVEITQADTVPEIMSMKMSKVSLLKHNTNNPRAWSVVVRLALVPLRLQYIIDSNVPRPDPNHPLYNRWIFWSGTIASWMYTQIDTTLQERIQIMAYIPEHADEMMEEIMLLVRGNDKADNTQNEINRFIEIKRSKFNSAKEFITEFQRQYHVLSRFKIEPHPFYALSIVLRELKTEIPKVQFITKEIAKLEPKGMTLCDVEQSYKALLAAAELDSDGTTNAAQSAGNRGGRGGRRGRGRGRGGRG